MAYTVYPPGGQQPYPYTDPNMPPTAGTPVAGGYNPNTQPWYAGDDPNPPANSPWSFPGAMPGFVQGYDPSKSLYGQMQGELDSIQPDMSGYDMFKRQAERTGPSAWAGLMNQQQDMMAKNAKSAGAATVAGQNQGAYDSLAMHGGLDSGARERVAREGSKSYLDMTQGVNRDTANNKLQIGVNDEQNRISQLSSLPGMYNQAMQPMLSKINMEGQAHQIDNSNAIAESDRQNQYNQGKYQTQMGGFAAGQQAYATMHQPHGSSFICTALRQDGLMTGRETAAMTKFMLSAIPTRADFFAWYFRHGKQAIEMARRQNFDFTQIKKVFVDDILEAATKSVTEAQNMYAERAGLFCRMFLGDCGYKDSLARPGLVKSILALPKVFLLKSTYVWAYGFFKAKADRKVAKIAKKVRLALTA